MKPISVFEENESQFDKIYDELVKVRTNMAKKLGYDNYVVMGYARMSRDPIIMQRWWQTIEGKFMRTVPYS